MKAVQKSKMPTALMEVTAFTRIPFSQSHFTTPVLHSKKTFPKTQRDQISERHITRFFIYLINVIFHVVSKSKILQVHIYHIFNDFDITHKKVNIIITFWVKRI